MTIELEFIAIYFTWNFEPSFLNYVGLDITTARKTVFRMSWNIMQSSKRRSKYHLPNTFLAEKRLYSPSPKISKQELISVTSKYYLSINFLTQKGPYFPPSKSSKQELFRNQ